MGYQILILFITIGSISDLVSSRFTSPILPKSAIILSANEQEQCEDKVQLLYHHRNVKISYEQVASDTTCTWKIVRLSEAKISVMAYKVDKVQLSKPDTGCIGLIKFPGSGYRCTMKEGHCFIYSTEDNDCNSDEIASTLKEKLQCVETVIRKVPEEEMLSISFHSNRDDSFKTSFAITRSYYNMECNSTNNTTTPGHMTLFANADTTNVTTNSTIPDPENSHNDGGRILGFSKMTGFLLLTTLPVIITLVGITVYAVRRYRAKPAKKDTPGRTSEVTQESTLRRCESNEYIQTEHMIEYELNVRNSFISFQDSENPSAVVPYTYKNETAIPERNGYLIPTNNDTDFVPTNEDGGYVIPPEEHNIPETSVYNEDPFQEEESPYEIVRDVFFRTESYSED